MPEGPTGWLKEQVIPYRIYRRFLIHRSGQILPAFVRHLTFARGGRRGSGFSEKDIWKLLPFRAGKMLPEE